MQLQQKAVPEAHPFKEQVADSGREQRGGQVNANGISLHFLGRQREKEIVPSIGIEAKLFPFQPNEKENQA